MNPETLGEIQRELGVQVSKDWSLSTGTRVPYGIHCGRKFSFGVFLGLGLLFSYDKIKKEKTNENLSRCIPGHSGLDEEVGEAS